MLSSSVGSDFSEDFKLPAFDSTEAFELLEDEFPAQSGDTSTIAFKAEQGVESPAVRRRMEALFAEAEQKGLWFYSSYQDLWFAPSELRAHMDAGQFCWSATNWRLRNPSEFLREKHAAAEQAAKELQVAHDRVNAWKERTRCR